MSQFETAESDSLISSAGQRVAGKTTCAKTALIRCFGAAMYTMTTLNIALESGSQGFCLYAVDLTELDQS
jgi:hypothetical protein